MEVWYNIPRWVTFILVITATSLAQTFNNPISRPQPGEILTAGSTYDIVWTPNTGDIIGIEIWNSFSIASSFTGSSCIVDDNNTMCSQIVASMPNSGSFSWKIPDNAPRSDDYFLNIYVPNPGFGGPFYYMTGNFSIRNATASTHSSTSPNSSIQAVSNHSSVRVSPAAVGGIVGAILGVSLAASLIFWVYRRRQIAQTQHTGDAIASGRTYDERSTNDNDDDLKSTIEEEDAYELQPVGGRIRYPEEE